jgi:hypothetical protein
VKTRADVLAYIKQFTGQANILAVPRVFVRFTGSIEAAALLNQILYWSERTDDPNGWFWKTAKEWEDELGLSYYKVSRILNKLKLTLGIETALHWVRGATVTHYRIDFEVFAEAFLKFLRSQETQKDRIEEIQIRSERIEETSIDPIQETSIPLYIETTDPETTKDSAAAAALDETQEAEPAAKPARPVPPHIAVIEAWHKNIPENLRPPGKPSMARNVRAARDIAEAGLTADQVGRFVRETYPTYMTWAEARGQPRVMTLEHVKTYLKDFLDRETQNGQITTKTGQRRTRSVLAEGARNRVPEGALGKAKL